MFWMQQHAAEPVPVEEKARIVSAILEFLKGETETQLLTYLFDRHLESPETPPTDADIVKNVLRKHEKTIDDSSGRRAMHRLRRRIRLYFDVLGSGSKVVLTIPLGRYALKFANSRERGSLFDWTWRAYLQPPNLVRFGLVQPWAGIKATPVDPFPPLEMFGCFSHTFKDYGVHVFPMRGGWQEHAAAVRSDRIRRYFDKVHYIIVGDDNCTRKKPVRPVGFNVGTAPDEVMDCLVAPLEMFRDPGDPQRAITTIKTPRRGESAAYCDNDDVTHVLFTRITLESSRQLTLLTSRHSMACAAVCDVLTWEPDLTLVTEHPELRNLPEFPRNVQMLFSVGREERDGRMGCSLLSDDVAYIGIECCRILDPEDLELG